MRKIEIDTDERTATHATAVASQSVGNGLCITTDGQIGVIGLSRAADGSCSRAIRNAIDCRWFDVVTVNDTIDMWVDGEGMIDPDDRDAVLEALNPLATLLVASHRPIYQGYCGTVVFTSHDGEHTVGLTDHQIAALQARAASLVRRQPELERRLCAEITAAIAARKQ